MTPCAKGLKFTFCADIFLQLHTQWIECSGFWCTAVQHWAQMKTSVPEFAGRKDNENKSGKATNRIFEMRRITLTYVAMQYRLMYQIPFQTLSLCLWKTLQHKSATNAREVHESLGMQHHPQPHLMCLSIVRKLDLFARERLPMSQLEPNQSIFVITP